MRFLQQLISFVVCLSHVRAFSPISHRRNHHDTEILTAASSSFRKTNNHDSCVKNPIYHRQHKVIKSARMVSRYEGTRLNAVLNSVDTFATILRGGGAEAAASTAINLSREGYYLQVLAAYGTVTALIMNATLRLYSSTKFPKDNKRRTRFLNSLFVFVTALCVLSGAFTAVLFNILGIYSKSALAMINDQGYLAFKIAMHDYTRWGFRTFLSTLASFVFSFNLSVYAKTENAEEDFHVRRVILPTTMALTLLGIWRIKKVINLATKYVFRPEYMAVFL